MRLYLAAPLSVPREAMEDCTIAGFHVPAGTRLMINLWKLQRDPSIWHKPLDFMPERFLSDHVNIDVRGENFELIPFGCGRRICPVDMSESIGITIPKATPLEVTLTPKLPSMLHR
ncbi:hypothetical protein F3Y22_tig00111023pilonHSYRG00040 [Hibiscus syriacus]|uniref:Uncharacterized protein n=1 Tax=Hibiscus syriacus TaxID=106335 RepID=A0A6A2Z6M4_HIBSY|nr:hypothetical protein F3Y22_tig00111023pilonHSYRG00040 [Hibiscus syriacus]